MSTWHTRFASPTWLPHLSTPLPSHLTSPLEAGPHPKSVSRSHSQAHMKQFNLKIPNCSRAQNPKRLRLVFGSPGTSYTCTRKSNSDFAFWPTDPHPLLLLDPLYINPVLYLLVIILSTLLLFSFLIHGLGPIFLIQRPLSLSLTLAIQRSLTLPLARAILPLQAKGRPQEVPRDTPSRVPRRAEEEQQQVGMRSPRAKQEVEDLAWDVPVAGDGSQGLRCGGAGSPWLVSAAQLSWLGVAVATCQDVFSRRHTSCCSFRDECVSSCEEAEVVVVLVRWRVGSAE